MSVYIESLLSVTRNNLHHNVGRPSEIEIYLCPLLGDRNSFKDTFLVNLKRSLLSYSGIKDPPQ